MSGINAWHDIKIGDEAPEVIRAVIEIPKDSMLKYEIDKETGMLKLDRFLYSAVYYPGDYGFVPQTLWHDGDPLDIIVLTQRGVYPMTLVDARIIGIIRMIDGDDKDDKLVAVYDQDPRYKEFKDIGDIPKHTIEELKHFFETYKLLQKKSCKVLEILDRETAYKDIKIAQELYEKKYGKAKGKAVSVAA